MARRFATLSPDTAIDTFSSRNRSGVMRNLARVRNTVYARWGQNKNNQHLSDPCPPAI